MSCDGNRHIFFQRVETETGGNISADSLERIYQAGTNRPGASTPATKQQNQAKTLLLFSEMRGRNIKPPVHARSGLPKQSAQNGYADVYDHLARQGFFADVGQPSRVKEAVGVASHAMGEVGVPRDQAAASAGDAVRPDESHHVNRSVQAAAAVLRMVGVPIAQARMVAVTQVWQFVPRCSTCGRWLPTQNPVCTNPRCGMKGEVQGDPVPWPPPGMSFKQSRVVVATPAQKAAPLAMTVPHDQATVELRLEAAAPVVVTTMPDNPDAEGADEDVIVDDDAILAAALQQSARPKKAGIDYRITDDSVLTPAGKREKCDANMAAIRLLMKLEGEGRLATPEEQEVLARYSGWGGLPEFFNEQSWWSGSSRPKPPYYDECKELERMLGYTNFQHAKKSVLNAHYTSGPVVRGVWGALRHLGFRGGRVLEPAVGVGTFFGLMPEDIAEDSTRAGVELDAVTAGIAKHLHQTADIQSCGFEDATLPDNLFDLAVSNVPFGNYPVVDKAWIRAGKPAHLSESIHNYFFAKALAKVRPGGVIAFVTSRYTMDSKGAHVREYLASQADLLGAIRLPDNAFQANAGTTVTTDIIFLRKRMPGDPPGDSSWTQARETSIDGEEAEINQYFLDHPEMMLGQLEFGGGRWDRALRLASDGRDLEAAIAEAAANLPADVYTTEGQERCTACGAFLDKSGQCNNPRCPTKASLYQDRPSGTGVRNGQYVLGNDGQIYQNVDGVMTLHPGSGQAGQPDTPAAQKVRALVGIRDAAQEVIRVMQSDAGDDELSAAQQTLNQLYDDFVAAHGPISSRENSRAFRDDPGLPLVRALEVYDPDTNTAQKEAIFTRRTVNAARAVKTADSAQAALQVSLDESGEIRWLRMSALTGKTIEQLQAELTADGIVFLTPENEWQAADEYLSGDVRKKLAEAQAAAKVDPAFQANVDALMRVVPKDLEIGEIYAPLGSGWIPPDVVQEYLKEVLQHNSGFDVIYIEAMGLWKVAPRDPDWWRRGGADSAANIKLWGTPDAPALKLIRLALNGKQPTIYDTVPDPNNPMKTKKVLNPDKTLAAREMQDRIKDHFRKWIIDHPDTAKRLEGIYNTRFNSVVPRVYDGSHLSLPGMNTEIKLHPHQKDAIWRAVQGGNTLLFHRVGAGKTFAMIGAGMEMRRLGMRKKVMYTVPNNLLEQFGGDIALMYPGAKVLLVGAEDMSPSQRAETMSRIATGDWDAIVVTHTAFESIPVSEETQSDFLREQIAELETALLEIQAERAGGGQQRYSWQQRADPTVKEIERAKARLEAKLETLQTKINQRRDRLNYQTWENLGVDQLFVDEADNFKNLYTPTRRTRLPGVQTSQSGRAWDMYTKVREIQKRVGEGKGIVFATGTPVANSVGEMYTMMRYLMLGELRRRGVSSFDAWATQFGETVTAIEMKPSGGGYRQMERFAAFSNVPELKRLFLGVADVQMDMDALGIVTPDIDGGKAIGVAVPATQQLTDYIASLVERADHLAGVDPSKDNMLKIVSDGRKAALDMRLVDPNAPDDPNSKLNQAVQRIWKIYQQTTGVQLDALNTPQNLSQMVFCDLGVPGGKQGDGFCVYDDIKAKLVALGVPEDEIQFMQDHKTDEEKLALFQKVNAGKVRVLIGSTETMGAGTNAQQRLVAMHHLDAPWRPRDVEQREGRILRQGNLNDSVQVYRYLTEGSFDVYNWQMLERKARFIGQIGTRDLGERKIEDVDAVTLSYAEMKALATGRPEIIEQVAINAELHKLASLQAAHAQRRWAAQQELGQIPLQIAGEEATIAAAETLIGVIEAATEADKQRVAAIADDVKKSKDWATKAEKRASDLEAEAAQNPAKAQEAKAARTVADTAAVAAKSKEDRFRAQRGFMITIEGRRMDETDTAGQALVDLENKYTGYAGGRQPVGVGEYLGFPLWVMPTSSKDEPPMFWIEVAGEKIHFPVDPVHKRSFIPGLEHRNAQVLPAILKVPEKKRDQAQQELTRLRHDQAPLEAVLQQPFEQEERLGYLRRRAEELKQILAEVAGQHVDQVLEADSAED